LDDFRETCALLVVGLRLFMATTTAISTREVEAVAKAVDSGALGLSGSFLSVSVCETTGASKVSVLSHDLYWLLHFQPLLSTSYA
jgi:hypothetical protein